MKNRNKQIISSFLAISVLSAQVVIFTKSVQAQTSSVGGCIDINQIKNIASHYRSAGTLAGTVTDQISAVTNVPTNIASVTSPSLNFKLDELVGLAGAIVSNIGDRKCGLTDTIGGATNTATTTAINVKEIADNGTSYAGALNGISGKGAGLFATKTIADISATTSAIQKIDTELAQLQATSVTSMGTNDLISFQGKVAQLQAYRAQLSNRLDSLKKQRDASLGDYARAFVLGLIHDLSLKLTNDVANKLVDKFKIRNYLNYVDTVANQMYSIDYIKKNFPEKENQLIVGSLYRAVYSKIPSAAATAQANITAQAVKYGGPDCIQGAAINDPDFVFKMAKCGSVLANPKYIEMVAMGKVEEARKMAVAAAEADASKSDYVPGRDCQDTLAQQQKFDAEAKTAAEEALKWNDVYEKLLANNGSANEIEQAKVNWLNAQNKNDELMSRDDNEILQNICTGIANPGQLVQNFVDDLVGNQLGSTNQLNQSDLPSYLIYLKNVVGSMVENLILGKNVKTTLKEAGLSSIGALAPQIAAGIAGTIAGNGSAGLSQAPNTDGMLTSFVGQNGQVTISWDVSSHPDKAKVASIAISGLGKTASSRQDITVSQNLKGSIKTTLTEETNIEIALRGADGKAFTSFAIWVDPAKADTSTDNCEGGEINCPTDNNDTNGGGFGFRGSAPQVAGAMIKKPALQIRGPQAVSFR